MVVAVNAMDHSAVCWADTLYSRIIAGMSEHAKKTGVRLSFVPISAKMRINLHEVSARLEALH
jgi:translation elongation factor EF-1alpha